MWNSKSLNPSIIRRPDQKAGKAIEKHHLIKQGDRIPVHLIKGKDVKGLLETLAGRLKFHPIKFKLAVILLDRAPLLNSLNSHYLKSFTEKPQAPFIHKLVSLDIPNNPKDNPYFICSWNRSKTLVEVAKDSGVDKMALVPHRGEAVEIFRMKMTPRLSISSMPPAPPVFKSIGLVSGQCTY